LVVERCLSICAASSQSLDDHAAVAETDVRAALPASILKETKKGGRFCSSLHIALKLDVALTEAAVICEREIVLLASNRHSKDHVFTTRQDFEAVAYLFPAWHIDDK
jgi:hypothetical protein